MGQFYWSVVWIRSNLIIVLILDFMRIKHKRLIVVWPFFKECVKTLRPFYLTHVVFGVVSCPPSLGHKLTTAARPRSDPDLDTMFVLRHVGHIRPTSTLYMGQEEVGPYKVKCMWATSACVRGGDVWWGGWHQDSDVDMDGQMIDRQQLWRRPDGDYFCSHTKYITCTKVMSVKWDMQQKHGSPPRVRAATLTEV